MARTDDHEGETANAPDAGADVRGVSAAIDADENTVECTLYPTDADERRLVTTWLTARGDAFVGLDEVA